MNIQESINGIIKESCLKDKQSRISFPTNKIQEKDRTKTKEEISYRTKKECLSSKTLPEIKTIEEKLLKSIENSEKIDKAKIELAETINFRENPDQIIDMDEFGFIKDSNNKNEGKKNGRDSLLLYNVRLEKWNYMLNNYENFYKNHFLKLKERTRKGIPDSLRGYAWQKIINLDEFYEKDLYQYLNEQEPEKSVVAVIIKDIDRTFPKCSFFKEKYGGGQRQLYKVLVNYSKYNKEVGYVQGMGFIVALLLTYMDEERTFFMIHALMKKRELEGLYLPGFPDLNKKLFVLLNLEKKLIPKVYNTLKKYKVMPFSYANEWFLCLFSRNLEFSTLVRIYDTFILEGYKIIYRFSLAFLKLKEQKIIQCSGMDSAFKVIKKSMENLEIDIDELFKIAFGFSISRKEIESYEKDYDKNKSNKKNEFILQL
jgi:hypothetical protein